MVKPPRLSWGPGIAGSNQANPEKLARISRHWAESERRALLLSS